MLASVGQNAVLDKNELPDVDWGDNTEVAKYLLSLAPQDGTFGEGSLFDSSGYKIDLDELEKYTFNNNLHFKKKADALLTNSIKPAIDELGKIDKTFSKYRTEFQEVLVGTAAQESSLKYRDQFSNGPAKGLFQMEPNTHDDIWANVLAYKPKIAKLVMSFTNDNDLHSELRNNDKYAAAMAGLQYWRYRSQLSFIESPGAHSYAQDWKVYYNTTKGHGTTVQFIENYLKTQGKP